MNFTYNLTTPETIIYKEAWFMPYNTEVLMMMIVSLSLAWLFHEAMHYIKANQYKLNPVYGWDHKGSFVTIKNTATIEQDKKIAEAGIIMGSLPIIITTLFIGLWTIIPLMLYILGCVTDIKKIIKKR